MFNLLWTLVLIILGALFILEYKKHTMAIYMGVFCLILAMSSGLMAIQTIGIRMTGMGYQVRMVLGIVSNILTHLSYVVLLVGAIMTYKKSKTETVAYEGDIQ